MAPQPIQRVGDTYGAAHGWEDFPVGNVTYEGALAYCDWAGLRLPTPEEWEKAARGTDGRCWPWGDELWGRMVALRSYSYGSTWTTDVRRVGASPKDVSPYGVHDMGGNVREWVEHSDAHLRVRGWCASREGGYPWTYAPGWTAFTPSWAIYGSPDDLPKWGYQGFRCAASLPDRGKGGPKGHRKKGEP